MKYMIVLAALLSVAAAQGDFAYFLPSNATALVPNIVETFECTGRQYGYYADVDNNCQLFHICWPYADPYGQEQMLHWSFLCGEGTMFDQSQLICNYPEYSLPCENAPDMYNINDYFGREDVEFRSGLNDIFKK